MDLHSLFLHVVDTTSKFYRPDIPDPMWDVILPKLNEARQSPVPFRPVPCGAVQDLPTDPPPHISIPENVNKLLMVECASTQDDQPVMELWPHLTAVKLITALRLEYE